MVYLSDVRNHVQLTYLCSVRYPVRVVYTITNFRDNIKQAFDESKKDGQTTIMRDGELYILKPLDYSNDITVKLLRDIKGMLETAKAGTQTTPIQKEVLPGEPCCYNKRKMCKHWAQDGFEMVNQLTGERFDPTSAQ